MEFKQAESYNSSSAGQREEGLVLAQLLSLQRGDKVLDLGCGTGYLTKMLADKVSPDGKVSFHQQLQDHQFTTSLLS